MTAHCGNAETATTHGGAPALRGGGSGIVTVSVRVARGLVEVAETLGVPRVELLRAAQLEPAILDAADGRVLRSDLWRLSELALELTADPALGLHWGERYSDSTFTPVAHLMAHAGTLREAFALLTRFHPLLTDERRFELVEDGERAIVRWVGGDDETPQLRRFAAEMFAAGVLRVIRCFALGARPERVCFQYPAPDYRAEYARAFDGVEQFEQAFTGVVFERGWLNASSLHQDEDVEGALRSIAEQRVSRLARQIPYALRVRELLLSDEAARRADMDTVARMLGVSVRSLRRRLAAEGKAYDAIANDALGSVAKQLLRDAQRTIQEVAFEMGFSDSTSFHRAFKRWTGTTPGAYRART